MASEKQKEHLEKARDARNEHQALLTRIKQLEAQVAAYGEVGTVFHDDTLSYTAHANRIVRMRSDWPDMFTVLTKHFGQDKYDR